MANFADGGKTIIVTARAAASAPGGPAKPQPDLHIRRSANRGTAQTLTPGPRFLVLIDPAHGGSEIGAAISS